MLRRQLPPPLQVAKGGGGNSNNNISSSSLFLEDILYENEIPTTHYTSLLIEIPSSRQTTSKVRLMNTKKVE
jgi:hypothetical protein